MTSSSSLYGTITTQNSSSSNSTSLYGEAGTPIPDSSGNLVVRGDLLVLSGNILTTAATGNIFPANATTINLGLAATAVNIGSATGSTTINNTLYAPGADFGNITIGVADDQTITTTTGRLVLKSASGEIDTDTTSILSTNSATFNLLNSPTTVNAFLGATSLNLGATTGTTNVNNNLLVEGTGTFTGDITAPGADLANITIGIADNQTITTTAGELRLSSTSGSIRLPSITSITTDTTGSFGVLNQPTTVNAFLAATALNLGASTGTTNINNDLLIDGNAIGLATGTVIGFNGNNTRANYPNFQSTSGNTSGIRVLAPNATTSAQSQLSAFATNDINNGEFLTMRASGSTTVPFQINTGKYTGGVAGTSGKSINFYDNTTLYAGINPAGPTVGTDLTTKTYVDAQIGTIPAYDTNVAPVAGGVELDLREVALGYTIVGSTQFIGGTNITVAETSPNVITISGADLNTTYTIDATSTTGGANLNLTGSDSSVDSVAYKGSGATTVTRTDANTITISSTDNNTTYTQDVSSTTGGANVNLNGSDSSVDSVAYKGAGSVTVTATDASTVTITGTDTNTTYDFAATSTTGGANLNLTGSDSTTDTVKLTNGGHITATYTSGTEVTLGSDATDANTASTIVARDASGNFSAGTITAALSGNATTATTAAKVANSLTAGTHLSGGPFDGSAAVTLTTDATNANTASTIVSRDASGNFSAGTITAALNGNATSATTATTATTATQVSNSLTAGTHLSGGPFNGSAAVTLTTDATNANTAGTIVARDGSGNFSAGTITANLADQSRVLGQLIATPVLAYTPVGSALTTVTGINGLAISSSTGGANGNAAQVAIRYHSGDTGAGLLSASAVVTSGATGTSTAPAGCSANQVLGAYNFDGYTTGTSNGYAAQIATANAGAGLNALVPIQAQAYARQGFTNSTTVTTAVTGASGTGSVATLNFTLQNTAPYIVGQTVTIAGMTPSGYNGTYVLTAATTSSISYANATTGFTSGGTIGAANTVTAAGMGYRIRGYANSTILSAANRINFMDLTASAATFKADAYTFADSVITGSTLTQTNYLTLGSTGAVFRNTGTNAYASMGAGGSTFTVTGINNFIRQGTTNTTQPALLVRYSRTDTTGSNDNDGVDFRLGTGGTTTTDNIARVDAQYRTSGLHTVGISVSTDSFSADTDTIYRGQADKTVIRATPLGTTGSASDILTVTQPLTTIKSDLTNDQSIAPGTFTITGSSISGFVLTVGTLTAGTIAAGSFITGTGVTTNTYIISNIQGGNGSGSTWLVSASQTVASTTITGTKNNLITSSVGLSYDRAYGDFSSTVTQTNAGATSVNLVTFDTTNYSSQVSIVSNTRITVARAGSYQLQWSGQLEKTDNGTDQATIWIRQNGVDIPNSAGVVTLAGNNAKTIAAWTYSVTAAAGDYFELCWFSPDIHVELVAIAAGTTPTRPAAPSVALTVTPIGA